MKSVGQDKLGVGRTLDVDGKTYRYFSLPEAGRSLGDVSRLPVSLKVLLENVLRFEDGASYTTEDAQSVADWVKAGTSTKEVPFKPARILMQDFTGVPAVVDLAAMRDGIVSLGGDVEKVNPLVPVDLVIDHSVMVDVFGSKDALERNVEIEFERNGERYAFLRWGQEAFENFRVVPPGAGICHQVNLEYLAQAVWTAQVGGQDYAYPDTLFGTDSHTTMVNGMGVLGWGVGGIEAEAAMLGQPIAMLIPDVIGVRLDGRLPEGATATDLVLTITQMLRKEGVVGKFVEFFGPALDHLPVADRATIANMAPEYGATCGFFPVDALTLDYLRQTGRDEHRVKLTEAYLKAQGMFREESSPEPVFTKVLTLDLATIVPSLAGPKRPQDRVDLTKAASAFETELTGSLGVKPDVVEQRFPVAGTDYDLGQGDVVIAAITSCTNTSNPAVLVAAGLVARKAHALGLKPKPWVKTSLAPGSQVVTDYLDKAGLSKDLDALGFETVGYGCTTCIGNSGPLAQPIVDAIENNGLVATSVLSGNRNFEGRISPNVRANYLASPPLVVAYALLGTMRKDITTEAIGTGKDGQPVYLRDIWPTAKEVADLVASSVTRADFVERYGHVTEGTHQWQALDVASDARRFAWSAGSTYIQQPPYFEGLTKEPGQTSDIVNARILALLADNVTTDHISPAGSIKPSSPAGRFLSEHQVAVADYNSYGSRRGNDRVMVRGTFANIRIRNEMLPGIEGGMSKHLPDGEVGAIYDVAERYKAEGVPLIVIGGKEYGMGSSRDWAAKGTKLLGIKAVIAESFERIHRSNLVGMGVLPLVFPEGVNRKTLKLDGTETLSITGLTEITPRMNATLTITRADGSTEDVTLLCRIDTLDEVNYYRHGGILPYVLRGMTEAA
ncbi:aconitate hydratase AcnA [Acidomonas methanolica]|uniref:Aconitate hydratase n=1 Tax=Acidomonas methanolica NBRC 104435 TaxID=1231351 RepID=A0A023D7G7_ACIMT|nr:aconitate hydratase AcnA [Acidomonas methanolica]MBU2655134.1 aconitate hydratase AcnA [Acidomonas methanolica]TCS25171.1 aconitate hydratase [Acidomonas methanolica]GAJ30108.1 aconitate hydratase [Acidomonas methanolica NBRC 104435]GBQ49324.1 aconitate hydratase [Acidomonas methanolica]GEK99666.1 aconitate hydratase [Acidomonas methanolica NBRC 104435]